MYPNSYPHESMLTINPFDTELFICLYRADQINLERRHSSRTTENQPKSKNTKTNHSHNSELNTNATFFVKYIALWPLRAGKE